MQRRVVKNCLGETGYAFAHESKRLAVRLAVRLALPRSWPIAQRDHLLLVGIAVFPECRLQRIFSCALTHLSGIALSDYCVRATQERREIGCSHIR